MMHMPQGIMIPAVLMETGALCMAACNVMDTAPRNVFHNISSMLLILWCLFLSGTALHSILMQNSLMFPVNIRLPVTLFTFFLFADGLLSALNPSPYHLMSLLSDVMMVSGLYGAACVADVLRQQPQ